MISASPYKGYVDDIVSECHETFVGCYHAFYPTSSLKWTSLCDLLASVNKVFNLYFYFIRLS